MNELQQYIDFMFRDVVEDQKVIDLKEEILSNSNERIKELMEEGYTYQDAMRAAIITLGDYKEMVDDLPKKEKEVKGDYVYKYIPKKLTPEETIDFAKNLVIGIMALIAGFTTFVGIMVTKYGYGEVSKEEFSTLWKDEFFHFLVIGLLVSIAFGVYKIVSTSIFHYGFKSTASTNEKKNISKNISRGIAFVIVGLGSYLVVTKNPLLVTVGIACFLALILGITLIIYTGITSQGKFSKENNNYHYYHNYVYENTRENEYLDMISSAIYILATVIFFILGFALPNGWLYSWLVYLVASAIHMFVIGGIKLKRNKERD